jgi:membrane-associated phospholipid phosphatase
VGAVGATLAVAAFAWGTLRRLDAVVLALGSPAIVFAAEKLLKQVVARRSPGSGVLLYPSGHLAVATALALTALLIARLARMQPGSRLIVVTSAWLFVLLLGRARLAETAHSLSDVVGGVATGVAVTLAVALLLDARSRRARRGAGGWRPR